MLFRRSILILCVSTLLGVGTGCVTRTVDLKINNEDRFTPSARGSYELYPGIDKRRSGTLLDLVRGSSPTAPGQQPVTARSAGISPTFAIIAEVAGVQGHDQEDVDLGEDVELQGIRIDGPVRLQLDSENVRGYLAGRGGVRFFDVATFEVLAGLGVDSTQLEVRTSTGVDRTDQKIKPGLLLGGRIEIQPIALFDLYAQSSTNFVDADRWIGDAEVGAELNITRNVSIFAGYRWWEYSEVFTTRSDWDFDISGPTAGANLKF
jgi:hypothetical protein